MLISQVLIVLLFTVVTELNEKFKTTLGECKKLNSAGLLSKMASITVAADKLLYNHAIQMVIYHVLLWLL